MFLPFLFLPMSCFELECFFSAGHSSVLSSSKLYTNLSCNVLFPLCYLDLLALRTSACTLLFILFARVLLAIISHCLPVNSPRLLSNKSQTKGCRPYFDPKARWFSSYALLTTSPKDGCLQVKKDKPVDCSVSEDVPAHFFFLYGHDVGGRSYQTL